MENWLLSLLSFFLFRSSLFFRLFLLLSHYLIRQPFSLPSSLKKIFQQLALDRRNLLFDFCEKFKLFRFFIGSFNVLINYLSNLLVAEFDPNKTIFLHLLSISSSFQLPSFYVFDGKVQMVRVIDLSSPNPIGQRLSEMLRSDGQSGSDRIKHVAYFLFSIL